MRQDRKQKDRSAAALVLCFCLMALISVFAVKAGIDKVRDNMQSENAADVVKEKAVDENSDASSDIIDSRDNAATHENDSDTSDASEFIVPVTGEIIMDYSMDMPVYWKTLDQYMTHSGVDISAPKGTSVSACAAGTVTRIEEDDKLGIIVEINHGNNIISVYGNMGKENLIELGEVVSRGDIIGEVGKTSLFEFEEEDHLHFEIRKNNEPVDPGNYISGL